MLAILAVLTCLAAADPLLWGPYRANLYFGMRPRIPHSLMTGLMWFSNDNFGGIQNLRHDCLQNDDATFSWTDYDTRIGGTQYINDATHNLNLTIDLAKSEDGKAWVVKVKGVQPAEGISSIVWYQSLEGDGDLDLGSALSPQGLDTPKFLGQSSDLGKFNLKVSDKDNKYPTSSHEAAADFNAQKWQYCCLNIPDDNLWKLKDVYLTLLQDNVNRLTSRFDPETTPLKDFPSWAALSLNNDDSLGGNTHFVQKVFKGPFEFEVSYNDFVTDWAARDAALDAKFAKIQAPNAEKKTFAKELLSNLAAGVGYFYGDSLASDSTSLEDVYTLPARGLYTATPSRAFFPRGFYWDEGFHLLGLIDQDLEQVVEILESWFGLMDEDGWIGREQILGPEARARVPKEFQVQVTSIANPPTLITFLAHLGTVGDDDIKEKLRQLFPQLETHFKWFRQSQKGKLLDYDREAHSYAEAYRWRGRTPTHVLASGIDDYPRSPFMSEGELNVDLIAWVGAMSDALASIASTVGLDDKAAHYNKITNDIKQNLIDLHWDEEQKAFCDVAVDDYEDDVHECHIGYVTHLPFFLRLLHADDEKRLLAVLEDIRDEEQLWSTGGIRSLSKADPLFGTGENYWRGAVWFNMNYLALDSLRFYYDHSPSQQVKARCASIYSELRTNLIENVYRVWKDTGKVWESYDGLTGNAKGAKQFSGWSALAANIMSWPESLTDDGTPAAGETAGPEPEGPTTPEEEHEEEFGFMDFIEAIAMDGREDL